MVILDKTMTIECASSDYISRLSSTSYPITFMSTVVAKHLSKCCTFATTIGYSQLVLPTIQFEVSSHRNPILDCTRTICHQQIHFPDTINRIVDRSRWHYRTTDANRRYSNESINIVGTFELFDDDRRCQSVGCN